MAVFWPDKEQEGYFWADRGVDDKADHFKPCGSCAGRLAALGPETISGVHVDLCDECHTALELQSVFAEMVNQRLEICRPSPEDRYRSGEKLIPDWLVPLVRHPDDYGDDNDSFRIADEFIP